MKLAFVHGEAWDLKWQSTVSEKTNNQRVSTSRARVNIWNIGHLKASEIKANIFRSRNLAVFCCFYLFAFLALGCHYNYSVMSEFAQTTSSKNKTSSFQNTSLWSQINSTSPMGVRWLKMNLWACEHGSSIKICVGQMANWSYRLF